MKETFKKIIIQILTMEARLVLKRHTPIVIAITGSLGKTGTKDAVAAALESQYTVRKSPKSFNSEFGVPLTILGLSNAWNNPLLWIKNIILGFFRAVFSRDYAQVLVLEIGADKPGDIASIAEWLVSDVVIITAIPEVPVHVEFYPTVAAVLEEKAQLINSLREGGVLLTGTDAFVSTLVNPHGKTVRIDDGISEIVYEEGVPTGMRCSLSEEGTSCVLKGVLGGHQCLAPAFALAVAQEIGVAESGAIQALEEMPRTPGRMRLLRGKQGSIVIDDSYNSSPTALAAALQTLGGLEVQGRKIAILGDMRELGKHSDTEHRRAGIQAAHIVDELYTLGPQAVLLAQAAIEEGPAEECVHIYETDTAQEVGQEVVSKLQQGDIVLVKSSQGTLRLEKAVKELLADESQAPDVLVRQEKEWQRR
jgi:UDP-N-acetylmuramoyl-tripeptide--D-alanyl-D-alanine ligase